MRRDERERDRGEEQREVGAAPADVDRLDAAEPDRADHQERRHQHHRQRRQRRLAVLEPERKQVDGRGDHRRGRRARHADEVALVGGAARLDVEARQAHRRGGDVDEARRPAEAPQRPQAPREREDRRREAERHDVGERIELDAEGRRRVGQPGEEAVERVEHHRDADEQRRRVEVGARRVDDAGVAAEQIRDREQRRQQEHAAPEPARAIVPPTLQRQVIEHPALQPREHRLAADDVLADRDAQFCARRQEHVHPRSEFHQPDALAALELVALGDAADDPARQHADDLPEDDRLARRDRSRFRSARCRSRPRCRPAGSGRAGIRCA